MASSIGIFKHYEKIIACVAVLLLAGSVAYVVAGRSSLDAAKADFGRRLDAMKPEHPEATPADLAGYKGALDDLARPPQLNVSSNMAVGFMSPEARIWCVACHKPIPFAAEKCVFCLTEQPKPPEADPDYDGDGGGIPDAIERQYGLDVRNADDDTMDSDGDGFSNLDEYLAGSDPMDKDSHPDLAARLRVRNIEAHKLPFRLQGKTRNPDGSYKCQINTSEQTYFVSVGNEIGKTGFTLSKFEPLAEKRADERLGGMQREFDVSRATIERDGREIVLVMDQQTAFSDYDITLVLTIDDTEYKATHDGTFKLRSKTYKVSGVDIESQSVVILDESDGTEVTVPRE